MDAVRRIRKIARWLYDRRFEAVGIVDTGDALRCYPSGARKRIAVASVQIGRLVEPFSLALLETSVLLILSDFRTLQQSSIGGILSDKVFKDLLIYFAAT